MIVVIGDEERKAIKKLIKHAEENITSLEMVKKTITGDIPPVGDDKNFVIHIPEGMTVVYSIEEHERGTMKHISLSVNIKDRVPSPEAVKMILKEFNFINALEKCYVKKEDVGRIAINVLEPLDGNWKPFQ